MKRTILTIAILTTLIFSGCVSISPEHYTIGYNGDVTLAHQYPICENKTAISPPQEAHTTSTELDSSHFTLLNWNSFKGTKEGWGDTFVKLSADRDLVTLQEASINEKLTSALFTNSFTWDLAAAFSRNDHAAGVLTASKLPPEALCSFRDKEPLLTIPKTSLITRYELSNTDTSLLLVNVHMINFTMGSKGFTDQLLKISTIVETHKGPVILTGDFNTWSTKRQKIVSNIIKQLSLTPVSYSIDERTRFFGEVVDHVYIRDLHVIDAQAIAIDTSDHNPILATFSVKEVTPSYATTTQQ